MQILSHRGFWVHPEEKNTAAAFERSFVQGFGTETDIRDLDGTLVISHDPPSAGAMTFDAFAAIYKKHGASLPLALNIKSDGLQSLLADAQARWEIANFFVFDMSIPDALKFVSTSIPTYTRESEFEPEPSLYETSAGIWMDCFQSDWVQPHHIRRHLDAGKAVCLVSPDLHRRPHEAFWEALKKSRIADHENLSLCTDHPTEAGRFFHG